MGEGRGGGKSGVGWFQGWHALGKAGGGEGWLFLGEIQLADSDVDNGRASAVEFRDLFEVLVFHVQEIFSDFLVIAGYPQVGRIAMAEYHICNIQCVEFVMWLKV